MPQFLSPEPVPSSSPASPLPLARRPLGEARSCKLAPPWWRPLRGTVVAAAPMPARKGALWPLSGGGSGDPRRAPALLHGTPGRGVSPPLQAHPKPLRPSFRWSKPRNPVSSAPGGRRAARPELLAAAAGQAEAGTRNSL